MRALVIDETFSQIVSNNSYITSKNPLSKVLFQYLNASSQVEASLRKISPLVINYPFVFPSIKYEAYL
jgi:hypothetical protein